MKNTIFSLIFFPIVFGTVMPKGYEIPEKEKNFVPNQKLCASIDDTDWKEIVYWLKKDGKCILCTMQCMFSDIGIISLKGNVEKMRRKEAELIKGGEKLWDSYSDFGCGPWPGVPPEKEGEITKENCNSLLGMAALGGSMDMVKYLVRKEKDVNAYDGNTRGRVLYSAALGGNYEVVKYLIKKGAKVKEHAAFENRTLLHAAANGGNLEIFNLFLKSKTQNVNAVDLFGQTVLHWAVIGKNKAIIKKLLKNGADKNAKDNFNKTPLDLAVERKNEEIVKILKEFKKQPEKPEKDESSGCLPDLF